MKELQTELFESVNANGEKVRFELEQKMFEEEYVSTTKDNWFMFGCVAALVVGCFAWWFI